MDSRTRIERDGTHEQARKSAAVWISSWRAGGETVSPLMRRESTLQSTSSSGSLLSSPVPWSERIGGGKRRDPGNEVALQRLSRISRVLFAPNSLIEKRNCSWPKAVSESRFFLRGVESFKSHDQRETTTKHKYCKIHDQGKTVAIKKFDVEVSLLHQGSHIKKLDHSLGLAGYSAKGATVSTQLRFLTNFWHFFDTLTKEPNIKFRATYQSQCLSYAHFDVRLLF